jgi:hypothetical protein
LSEDAAVCDGKAEGAESVAGGVQSGDFPEWGAVLVEGKLDGLDGDVVGFGEVGEGLGCGVGIEFESVGADDVGLGEFVYELGVVAGGDEFATGDYVFVEAGCGGFVEDDEVPAGGGGCGARGLGGASACFHACEKLALAGRELLEGGERGVSAVRGNAAEEQGGQKQGFHWESERGGNS